MKEINVISIDERCIIYEESDEEESCIGCTCFPEDVDYDED